MIINFNKKIGLNLVFLTLLSSISIDSKAMNGPQSLARFSSVRWGTSAKNAFNNPKFRGLQNSTFTPYFGKFSQFQKTLPQCTFGTKNGNWRNSQYQQANTGIHGMWAGLLSLFGLNKAYEIYQTDDSRNFFGNKKTLAQERKLFESESLDQLENSKDFRKTPVIRPGKTETWYTLIRLHSFLKNEAMPKDEYHTLSYLIKELVDAETIKTQNPDFYLDIIKSIGIAYNNTTNNEERAQLKEKVIYLLQGDSEKDKNFAAEMKSALNGMFKTNLNESETTILKEISNWTKSQSVPETPKQKNSFFIDNSKISKLSYNLHEKKPSNSSAETLQFDRENMKCGFEGYWASSKDPSKDTYMGMYPFPQANPEPWPTQYEFLEKLQKIEQQADRIGYRGLSTSRFEDIYVGSREFSCKDPKTEKTINWPEAFGPYYVQKFNVKPSKEFYEFVMNYPLTNSEE